MKQKMMNSRFGKFLRRLVGEETGAVMMEYVIVAVLIAAACVIGVAMFGKNIVGMFGVAAKGAGGEGHGAASLQTEVRSNTSGGFKEAGEAADKFSDTQKTTKAN